MTANDNKNFLLTIMDLADLPKCHKKKKKDYFKSGVWNGVGDLAL